MTLEAQTTKQKTDKLYFIIIKNFAYKRTISTVKRKLMEWEKIFAQHISTMVSYPKYIKNFYNLMTGK